MTTHDTEFYGELRTALVDGFTKQAFEQHIADGMADEIVKTLVDLEKSAEITSEGDLEKVASQFSLFGAAPFASHVTDALVHHAAPAAAKALGALAASGVVGAAYLGAAKASGALSRNMDHRAFISSVEKAINKSYVLQKADRAKIMEMAETIFKYAPSASSDPNLLSSLLSQAVQMEGIDVNTIKMLTDLERVHAGNTEPKQVLGNFLR